MKCKFCFLLVLVLLGVTLCAAPPTGWETRAVREGKQGPLKKLVSSTKGMALPLSFPGWQEFVLSHPHQQLPLDTADSLVLTLNLPEKFPTDATVTVFSKDNDFLWRQIRCPLSSLKQTARGMVSLTVPLAGPEAVKRWESCGHTRPWTGLTARNLLELGFRFEAKGDSKAPYRGEGWLTDVSVIKAKAWKPGPVSHYSVNTLQPQVGKRLEVSFQLDGWVTHPYDSSLFKIQAEVSLPGKAGGKDVVSGYYWEDFLYDETEADKSRCLRAHGAPRYAIRYVPRRPGKHSMTIRIRQGKEQLVLPPFSFDATPAPSDYHGFIQVDAKHHQFFAYEDGTIFRGLGMNVRSPFDDRYFGVAPYSLWRDKGLQVYDQLFKTYEDIGINVVEVWMCSWWLALEWTNDSPGFHGVGHYNQYRAWMLDHIMELAEKHGIHVILVLNNHGKFGMTYDTEWARNPYNKARGGYLKKCEDYFSDPRAKADFKKTADYIVARWGASPNLLAWKLFTEVDLTGQTIQAYLTDKNIPQWHREMGQYLKTIDIHQHPVTTHWMLNYARIDRRVAALKEIDFLSTDAYYSLGGGTQSMISLIAGAANFGNQHKKPMVITEFGGSSYADSMRNLMNQVEVGLWTGFFHEMGILPMYWWFGLVEDKKLHGYYRCLSRFQEHEDRRDMKTMGVNIKGGKTALKVHAIASKDRILVWMMDADFFNGHEENKRPELQKNKVLAVPVPKQKACWNVEVWNPATGDIVSRTVIKTDGQRAGLEVPLPEFRKSLAVKILKEIKTTP